MGRDSLQNLLQKFPYFFDKSVVSNFYKSQSVTNEQFKNLYQSLFDLTESFHLNKKVLVWKEQLEPYIYTMHFVANLSNLKTVKIYKNDNLIYTNSYEDTDEITSFNYFYNYDTRNDIIDIGSNESNDENPESLSESEAVIIPIDTFIIEINTYNEITITKGFPENDEKQDDVYDHDYSLDEIGILNNILRKEYIVTDDYAHTEPKYNNKLTEDDYHYMKRILNYNLLAVTAPLPVAEIWKLYGLDATMINRERLLLKMFDIKKHEVDENPTIVSSWVPEPWEHKDGFCKKNPDLGIFFFATAKNINPPKYEDFKFKFQLLNGLAESIDEDFTVDVYLNNNLRTVNYPYSQYVVDGEDSYLDESNVNVFKFIGKIDGVIIGEVIIEIYVRGCSDADFYVSSRGNDNNPGTSTAPFKTITKALSLVSSSQNLIAVIGEIDLDQVNTITTNCTIIGCNHGTIKSSLNNARFFNLSSGGRTEGTTLKLTDLYLKYKNYSKNLLKKEIYTNFNKQSNNYETVIIKEFLLISELDTDYLITDIEVTDEGEIYITKEELSSFTSLRSLQNVIIDLTIDEEGNLCKEYFVSESIANLESNKLFPEDIEIMKKAITNVSITDDGDFEVERIEINVEGD